MSIDQRLNEMNAMRDEFRAMMGDARSIAGGGGGGGMDQMTGRVTRLEGQYDGMSDRLGRVEVQIATLNERVAHLPSKEFIIRALLGCLAVIAGLVTFGDRLQALVQ